MPTVCVHVLQYYLYVCVLVCVDLNESVCIYMWTNTCMASASGKPALVVKHCHLVSFKCTECLNDTCLEQTWHHPYGEAWWWQHHYVGMFFSCRDWETSQDWWKTAPEHSGPQTGGEGSPSNRTKTLSTQPRYSRSGFGKSLWMSLSGPARARTWTQSNISGETWK